MSAQSEVLQDALNIVLSAAEVRLLQWQAAQRGTVPEDLINELYEAAEEIGGYEAEQMVTMIGAAIDMVRELDVQEEPLALIRLEKGGDE